MSMAESLGKHLTAKAAEDAPEETAGSRRMSLGHEAVLQTVTRLQHQSLAERIM